MFLQIFGMSFVLFGINSNLGIISGSSIYKVIIDWFKHLPQKFKKGIKLGMGGDTVNNTSSEGGLSLPPEHGATEEKFKFLFHEVKKLNKKIHETEKRLETRINDIDKLHNKKYDLVLNKFNDLDENLKNIVVGGARAEILGVFTIIYGILIPHIFQ